MALPHLASAAAPTPFRRPVPLRAVRANRPKVLFATAEFAGLAQTGGLADVSAALPRALNPLTEVRVVMPGYAQALAKAGPLTPLAPLPAYAGLPACGLALATPEGGPPTYFVLNDDLYGRHGLRGDASGREFPDNDLRFARLSLAVAEIALNGADGWTPDVVHLNDWETALAAGYMAWTGATTPTLLTIHNLARQGEIAPDRRDALGIPGSEVEAEGGVSFLRIGLDHASHVTTVSETYAREILSPFQGCGLQALLSRRAREGRLTGILNGVDPEWDPRADRNCPFGFDPQRWKARYGDFVRGAFNLSLARAPLFAFVAPLTLAKGADLVAEVAERIVAAGAQLVAIGDGEAAAPLTALAERYPRALGVRGYDPDLARACFAGADFALAPSRFEPCGLGPIYAQRLGALPIVHATGGHCETVFDGRTGYLFEQANAKSLAGAVERALALYAAPQDFSDMRRAAMGIDFDWRLSAQRYADLYETLRRAQPATALRA